MEFNTKKKNMQINYDSLQKFILFLKSKYKFLGISFIIFDDLIEKEIIKSIEKYNEKSSKLTLNMSLDSFIKLNIKNSMINFINIEVEKRNLVVIIDEYINRNITKISINDLYEISNFFNFINYNVDLDFCISLLNKNEDLNDLIASLVKKNMNFIVNNNLRNIFNNNFIIALLSGYCFINNIRINIKEDNENMDFSNCYIDIYDLYLRELEKKLLSKEEEKELAIKASLGDKKAKDKLIEKNLRLVINIAKKYFPLSSRSEFLDFIQEGNIGLMQAIEKYDVNKGFSLSTYATWWIERNVNTALKQERIIKLPRGMLKIIREYKKLQEQSSENISKEEIASKLGISLDKMNLIYRYIHDASSINFLMSENENEFEYSIDLNQETTEDIVMKDLLKEEFKNIFQSLNLTERDIKIMENLYGLNGCQAKNSSQVCSIFGISRQRVEQIENEILKKIRFSKYAFQLASYTIDPEYSLEKISDYKEKYYKKK